jgi:hypothetical protein
VDLYTHSHIPTWCSTELIGTGTVEAGLQGDNGQHPKKVAQQLPFQIPAELYQTELITSYRIYDPAL